MKQPDPASQPHEPFLTLTEAASLLKCHHNTVRAWVRQGKLEAVPMGVERVAMFRKRDVEALRAPLEKAGVIQRDDKHAFPVVGIGASAGGLDAISRVLAHLPTDLGMAYVVVQHLEKDREVVMVELLRKRTAMPVFVIENGMRSEPDRVYVSPGSMRVAIVDGVFTLRTLPQGGRPIDDFFTSLAEEYQNNAIGIILSGTGTDGTEGARRIREEDGLTLAQDGSALEKSMPVSAQEAEVVDLVVKPEEVGKELAALVKQLYPGGQARIPSKYENELRRILVFLHGQRGIDFTQYKEATIHRRIIRRMVLSKCRKLSDYSALLHGSPSEVDTLCNDMLINVTSFFRDPLFHKALDKLVFPALLKDRPMSDPLRIWVAACAGGEEVVSIAITLLEHMGDRGLPIPVQIFATDLNERTIEKARLGIYKKNALQHLEPELLKKYFQHVDGHFQVVKTIRDMCVFAKHDLLKDPPFSRVDLVSCQNMLIYLENEAQERVVHSFHYALKPSGFLALGKSESASVADGLFDQPDRGYKVYTKKYSVRERLPLNVRYKPYALQPASDVVVHPPTQRSSSFADLDRDTERLLLSRYVPPSVVVGKDLDIIRFRGAMTPYLAPTSGKASLNLLKMVREELAFELRGLFQRVRKEQVPVRKAGIPLRVEDVVKSIALEVAPLGDTRPPHYLVVFTEEIRPVPSTISSGRRLKNVRDERERRILHLEQELTAAREQMRIAAEEAEANQQELQAANEEVVSSNEELQSINEELETSKEELQSINEEFATINEELQARNEALLESEERYRRLIELMPVAVYTCDATGHVRLFNEAAVRLWGRTPVVGEALWCGSASMRTTDGHDLPLDACPMAVSIREERAMTDVEAIVVRPGGEQRAVLANPTPLYDHQGRISGAINVLVDVTERMENARRLDLATRVGNLGIWDWDIVRDTISWTDAVYTIHGVEKGSFTPNMSGYQDLIHPDDRERVGAAIRATLEDDVPYVIEFRTVNARGEVNWVFTNAVVIRSGNRPVRMMGGTMNITDRKKVESDLQDSESRFKAVFRHASFGIVLADEKGRMVDVNEAYERMVGWSRKEMIGRTSHELGIVPDAALRKDMIQRIIHSGHGRNEVVLNTRSGEAVTVSSSANVVWMGGERFIIGIVEDITERKRAEEALRTTHERLQNVLGSITDGLAVLDKEWRYTYFSEQGGRMLGVDQHAMIGQVVWDMFPHAVGTAFEHHLRVAMEQGTTQHFEEFYPEPLNKWLELHCYPSAHGLSIYFQDVTERRVAEQRLQEVSARLDLALDSADLGTWNIDADLVAMEVDERFKTIFGWKGDTIDVAQAFSVLHPDDRARVQEAIAASTRPVDTQPYEIEYRVVHPDASVHWVFARGRAAFKETPEGRTLLSFNGTVLDITQRKGAEEAQRNLAAIVESSDDAILSRDLNGIITSWNKAAQRIFGYTADEIIGKPNHLLYPPGTEAEEVLLLEKVRQGERVEHFETQRLHKNGTLVPVALTLSPLKDEEGRITGASKVMRDVTESRRAREIIRASEERFHLLADNVSQLVWMAEADGSSMWFNQRWTEFTGLTGEEIRMDARQLHHPDHFDRVRDSLKQRAAEAEPWEEQFPLKSRHGVYHWFLATAMPVRDEAGNVIRWFGTCTDITSQREAQERLQESEERFRLLADNIGQLAWIAEADGEINWYNKRWFDYSGTTLEEMRGWGWQKIHHPDHVEAVTRKFQEHIALEKDWQDTFPIRGADGEYRWFLSRAFPVRDAQGRVQRWFGTNTDITEQKLAEEALEEGARHKDHFLATLAHELRNPLAPLKNGLQLMELAPDDPEMLDRTRAMMARQLDHMVRLVDDLMDLSRISRGKIELLNQPVDLPAVLATAIESTKPLMDQRRHTLEVRIGKGPFPMNGDPARLTQVVANLLNNSAKYTPEQGRIELSMERSDDTVVITVSDNGIGIPVDSLEHVFDMFAQVDPAKQAREGGGLGIGLNIVQRLIHMHQGTVTAFSEGPRKGSTFTVRLPLHATPVDNTPAPVEQIGASGEKATWRVLVVDDNQDAAISMSMILRKQGHEVRTAHDGLEGVRLVEEFRPDVVFMDIGMPRMNGYEACVAIRNGPQGEDLYMVALSGWGQEEDRKKSEEAGFDQHVVKPIDRRTLDRLMTEARTRRSVSGSASLS